MDMGIDGHHNGPLVNVGNALKKNIKNPLLPRVLMTAICK